MALESQHFPEYTGHNGHNGFQQARSSCRTEYDHVTVVKQGKNVHIKIILRRTIKTKALVSVQVLLTLEREEQR